MGGADLRNAGVAIALCALLTGCAPAPKPEPLPPQAVSQHRPEPVPPPAPAAPTPPPPSLVVVDPGEPETPPPASLAEAAQREKERRRGAEKPAVVITNQNLAEFAKDQKLTVAEGAAAPAGDGGLAADEAALAEKEEYWRQRGLEIRRRWRDAADSVARLEEEAAGLRRQFYSTDDPYVRDNQVKPEWDRVLAELDRARRTVAEAPRELERFLDEGRRAGALPGWLREGLELEPEEPAERRDAAEPQEPKVLEEGPEQP